jgi:hypothetical protein
MTRPTAIDQEREQLDAMIRLLGLEVDGEPTKRESPDFLIKLRDGRNIGVELVRALNEQIASGRGTRSRIKRQVHVALQSAGINAWVHVRLNENTAGYLNGEADALRREIAAIVELARTTMSGAPESRWYNFEWIDHEYDALFGDDDSADAEDDVQDLEGTGVQHADAVGIHPRDEPLVTWSIFGGGQRPSIVQDAIDDKAENLDVYRQCGADEIWLLVIGSAGTGGALFIDDVDGRVLTSPYDRTIFLELYEGRCMVLNTTPPGTATPAPS